MKSHTVVRDCQPLRIAIHTSGRFHVCDLARELSNFGHDVRFHSIVPPWRTRKFGLPDRCNRWELPKVAHWLAAVRAAHKTRWRNWADEKFLEALDRAASRDIEPCDVFIGMSGMSQCSAATARRKYGAKIWIERGSRHILSQKAILENLPGADQVPDFAVKRELTDYEQADTISVLSRHCEESFEDYGVTKSKLFRNPLGVDLSMFSPTPAPPAEPPTILMTGAWSLRKGCDVLTAAWRQLPGVKLLHVGPVGDYPLPSEAGFEHVDKVEQSKLLGFYARGHVFALASREEGLATVQPQALASGLRLVCSDRTGGADLGEYIADPNAVRVVPTNDPNALASALRAALNDARADCGLRDRLGAAREEMTWAAYGRRYAAALRNRMGP
jgi:starch synthase